MHFAEGPGSTILVWDCPAHLRGTGFAAPYAKMLVATSTVSAISKEVGRWYSVPEGRAASGTNGTTSPACFHNVLSQKVNMAFAVCFDGRNNLE